MTQKIEVPPEVRQQLCDEFFCTRQTVYNALNYTTNRPLSKMLCRRALELGGKLWTVNDYYLRTTPDGTMELYNGVDTLVCSSSNIEDLLEQCRSIGFVPVVSGMDCKQGRAEV